MDRYLNTLRASESLVTQALRAASHTRVLIVEPGVRMAAGTAFESVFGQRPAVVVADVNTFSAAGADVQASLAAHGLHTAEPIVLGPDVHAEHTFVERLTEALATSHAVPVAVGSGTINDLTKLSSHRLNRPYMTVATAASMDGYTAYGASITQNGSKQTFECPAPVAVLADLDVIAHAPEGMNASGYADLFAKCAAGADWILADAAGIEPIDPHSWNTVQQSLPDWVASPGGVALANPDCLRNLVSGLMMGGFAMQALHSSRPASGAEHQFSHLWDMQGHVHNGHAPSHGFKVGIGTLASLAVYENLLRLDRTAFSVDAAIERSPDLAELDRQTANLFEAGELRELARREIRAKHVSREELPRRLERLRDVWPALQPRLAEHLRPFADARRMLSEAGCPTEPEQIGISRERLRRSYQQAFFIRRRFTVLDFAAMWGLTERILDHLFADGGYWAQTPVTTGSSR